MEKNQFKLIGLGKMGYSLFQNMILNDINVIAYDYDVKQRTRCLDQSRIVDQLSSLFDKKRSIYWMMLPAGEITETIFTEVLSNAIPGDIIIDGGNAHYRDSSDRALRASIKQVGFLDVGVSGGHKGALEGACFMVGGDPSVFVQVEDELKRLCVSNGLLHTGPSGSGHYAKMIHNGIEYGMMQSIAEGFNIINHCDFHDFDTRALALLFNSGSVIRGWLMELTHNAFSENPDLKNISGIVASSGEGKWTVEEALRLQVNTPVITQSLMVRYASQDKEKYGERLSASLRNQFGGHAITHNDE